MRRILFLLLLLALLIQSCKPLGTPAIETPPPVSAAQFSPAAPSPTIDPVLPASPEAQATLLPPSATPAACITAGGHVEVAQITIELLPDPLMYHIYLPPCYDEQTDRRYPVLYLVHGMNADDSQWVFMGVPGVLNRLVRTGELPPFIVVMPRDRIWAEPTVDNFGQAVVQDLLPWVDAHYRTLPQREYRLIGGLSWGGAWALHLGFSHPELFSAVGMHSSIVFGTDVLPLMGSLLDFPPGLTPRIYMDIGVQDRPDTLDEISWVEGLLAKKDIPHEWHLYQGKHNDTYWRSHVEEYLRWYSQSWSTDPALSYP